MNDRRPRPPMLWLVLWLVLMSVMLALLIGEWPASFASYTPILMAPLGGFAAGYHYRHGYWIWDRKRHKIRQWQWLVQDQQR